ncbi:MAG: hypothetical protein U9N76_06610 [Candidatus Marinimicrobia bacterium]|nr:hypothetical protein [Candidatus Neomarinimicrobiota bacterium]
MLHFNSAKRLSIDIDIILPEENDELNDILNSVATEQGLYQKEQLQLVSIDHFQITLTFKIILTMIILHSQANVQHFQMLLKI